MPASSQEPWRFATEARVVAFADVHGAYGPFVEVLRATGLVDPELHWSGGAAHAVSLGDLLDRGAEARTVLELVIRLQREADAAGGRLHVVLGNHELMNLLGDWRYVARTEYESFAGDETEAMRAAAYEAFAARAGGSAGATRAQFDDAYPRGYFARQAAYEPSGRYGAWLLSLPALIVVNDTAYVHGGLPRVVADEGLAVNERVQAALTRYLELRARLVARGVLSPVDRQRDVESAQAARADPERDEFLALAGTAELGLEGPLWYRGSIYCKPLLERPTLEAALARLSAARVVVGHTVTGDRRVRSLYDGKLVTLDTGMLADYFEGRPAALVSERGALAARYAAPAEDARPLEGAALAYARTEAALRAALASAEIVTVRRTNEREPWQVSLRDGDATIGAAFYPKREDRASDLELAAAALDDLLGTDLVAPTVVRVVEGQEGALQLRYPGAVSDSERVERRLGFSGWCPIEPQLELVRTFDILTLNRGRTSTNVLFDNDLTDVTLVDHRRAFPVDDVLPPNLRNRPMPAALRGALLTLDAARFEATLGAWLDARRIRALLARRDQLVGTAR